MNKTLKFQLNNFCPTPNALRKIRYLDEPDTNYSVNMARLYHHYYCDSYGVSLPNPNHANFEYLRFLAGCNDFRFIANGPAINTGKKRAISAELGQAFLRYFLYEFCDITYFAHMSKIIGKQAHPAFNGLRIDRVRSGNTPDYLCCHSVSRPFIGEAKGRFSDFDFTSAIFQQWRNQFSTVTVYDGHRNARKLKGYIIATRFTTEADSPTNYSTTFAEDPETFGDEGLDNDIGLGRGCIAVHYARLLSKLGLGLLSESLDAGFIVPQDLQYTLPVWRCLYQPLNGETFVGGYLSDIEVQFSQLPNKNLVFHPNILRLGIPAPTFLGLSTTTFMRLREVTKGKWEGLSELPILADTDFRLSNLAWLRDGSISGSLEFFEFIGFQTF